MIRREAVCKHFADGKILRRAGFACPCKNEIMGSPTNEI